MEQVVLAAAEQQRIAHGLTIVAESVSGERCAALDESSRLVAILGRRPDGSFRAVKNFAHGD
jgi:hypothetical protein